LILIITTPTTNLLEEPGKVAVGLELIFVAKTHFVPITKQMAKEQIRALEYVEIYKKMTN
jgi:hypothetical protein